MKKMKEENVAYTFEEYRRKFYPQMPNQQLLKKEDPHAIGVALATETLNKFRTQVSNK